MCGCQAICSSTAEQIVSQLPVQLELLLWTVRSAAQHPLLNVCSYGFIELEAVGFPVICNPVAREFT